VELMTLQQATEQYPAFPVASLRWMLFQRNTNGLSKAIVKVGRRVFIDRVEFEKWLDNQRETK